MGNRYIPDSGDEQWAAVDVRGVHHVHVARPPQAVDDTAKDFYNLHDDLRRSLC